MWDISALIAEWHPSTTPPHQLGEFVDWKISSFLQIPGHFIGWPCLCRKHWAKRWHVHITTRVIIKRFNSLRWFQNLRSSHFSLKIEFPLSSHSVEFIFLQMLNLYIPRHECKRRLPCSLIIFGGISIIKRKSQRNRLAQAGEQEPACHWKSHLLWPTHRSTGMQGPKPVPSARDVPRAGQGDRSPDCPSACVIVRSPRGWRMISGLYSLLYLCSKIQHSHSRI